MKNKLDLLMKPWLKTTKRNEQTIAETSIDGLSRLAEYIKENGSKHVHLVVPGVQDVVEIPTRSVLMFKEMMAHVAKGRSVALYHSEMELTTQQAADMLNVSRPHVVKLLEAGAIRFTKMNSHRRIAVADLMEYAEKQNIALKLQKV